MIKFLITASYSPEGMEGLLKSGGTSRKQSVEKMITDLGGKIEAFYYAIGDADVYAIAELPDTNTISAMSMAINATGMVSVTTTILISPEDIDKAAKISINYRAPGS